MGAIPVSIPRVSGSLPKAPRANAGIHAVSRARDRLVFLLVWAYGGYYSYDIASGREGTGCFSGESEFVSSTCPCMPTGGSSKTASPARTHWKDRSARKWLPPKRTRKLVGEFRRQRAEAFCRGRGRCAGPWLRALPPADGRAGR